MKWFENGYVILKMSKWKFSRSIQAERIALVKLATMTDNVFINENTGIHVMYLVTKTIEISIISLTANWIETLLRTL